MTILYPQWQPLIQRTMVPSEESTAQMERTRPGPGKTEESEKRKAEILRGEKARPIPLKGEREVKGLRKMVGRHVPRAPVHWKTVPA